MESLTQPSEDQPEDFLPATVIASAVTIAEFASAWDARTYIQEKRKQLRGDALFITSGNYLLYAVRRSKVS